MSEPLQEPRHRVDMHKPHPASRISLKEFVSASCSAGSGCQLPLKMASLNEQKASSDTQAGGACMKLAGIQKA